MCTNRDDCEHLESLKDVEKHESVRVRVARWLVQRRKGSFHGRHGQTAGFDLRGPIPIDKIIQTTPIGQSTNVMNNE